MKEVYLFWILESYFPETHNTKGLKTQYSVRLFLRKFTSLPQRAEYGALLVEDAFVQC